MAPHKSKNTPAVEIEEEEIWTFGHPHDSMQTYADGTQVPHRGFKVLLNGEPVGEIEIHMHKRRGRDGETDVSFGVTNIVYGPIAEDPGN